MANIPVVFTLSSGSEVSRDFSEVSIESYTVNDDMIEVSVDESIAEWRISYDVESEAVVVKYDGMSNEDAIAQYEADVAAANAISNPISE